MEEEEEEQEKMGSRVALYEKFVEGRLKKDLHRAVEERSRIEANIQSFERLNQSIRLMESHGSEMHEMDTLVNIGSDILAQAHVPDTRSLFVCVGLGFWAELTRLEALEFAEAKVTLLNKDLERIQLKIASIKASIKLATEGLSKLAELQQQSKERAEELEEDN